MVSERLHSRLPAPHFTAFKKGIVRDLHHHFHDWHKPASGLARRASLIVTTGIVTVLILAIRYRYAAAARLSAMGIF